MSTVITLTFDGSCELVNPGGTAVAAWTVEDCYGEIACNAEVVCKGSGATNNVAEWCALLYGLRWIKHNLVPRDIGRLTIRGDSALVINQLNGKWRVKKEHLMIYYTECVHLLNGLVWDALWIPRKLNTRCDELSKSLKS